MAREPASKAFTPIDRNSRPLVAPVLQALRYTDDRLPHGPVHLSQTPSVVAHRRYWDRGGGVTDTVAARHDSAHVVSRARCTLGFVIRARSEVSARPSRADVRPATRSSAGAGLKVKRRNSDDYRSFGMAGAKSDRNRNELFVAVPPAEIKIRRAAKFFLACEA